MKGEAESEWRPSLGRHTIQVALHYPGLALAFLVRRRSFEETVRRMVERDLSTLRRRYAALGERADSFLRLPPERVQHTLRLLVPARRANWGRVVTDWWYGFLYSAVRSLRPRFIVETGVYMGASSAAILQALEDNGSGVLHSIDLPTADHQNLTDKGRSIQIGLPSSSLEVGFAVPRDLRREWVLHLGNSLGILPGLLERLPPISMFVHDSLHTYDHMNAEFTLGYDALHPGGLLVSDDISYNRAWADFCEMNHEQGVTLPRRDKAGPFGYVIKSH